MCQPGRLADDLSQIASEKNVKRNANLGGKKQK